MTSLNKDETTGAANRIKDHALFELLPEAILERCSPVKWPASQTFTDVKKVVVVFMFFVVKVVIVPRPTTTDTKDVQESLGFRLMPVRIVGVSFSNSTSRERVLP